MRFPLHLLKMIEVFKKLPGVGKKSAERFAFDLLSWEPSALAQAAEVIRNVPEKLSTCDTCGCLGDTDCCLFCSEERQISGKICIVAFPKDVFYFEETGEFKGLYHVLGTLLSPMDGIGPGSLPIDKLIKRVESQHIQEMIIAIDSTLEGDATALYIKQELCHLPIKITRLAFGLPMGSSLDYVDGGTLAHAFQARGAY